MSLLIPIVEQFRRSRIVAGNRRGGTIVQYNVKDWSKDRAGEGLTERQDAYSVSRRLTIHSFWCQYPSLSSF